MSNVSYLSYSIYQASSICNCCWRSVIRRMMPIVSSMEIIFKRRSRRTCLICVGLTSTSVQYDVMAPMSRQRRFRRVSLSFNNGHSQSHVYSIPFVGTRLDFVSNRFSLFDTRKTFSHVTTSILYDDVQPCEHVFFD